MLKTVSSITNAIGALNYKGTWNASTNTPTLASGVGTKGDYYQVSVAGSTSLDGLSNWGVGDVAAFNGTTWQRIEGGADLNGVNLSVTGNSDMGNVRVTGNTISSTNTNGNVTVDPNGSGYSDIQAKQRITIDEGVMQELYSTSTAIFTGSPVARTDVYGSDGGAAIIAYQDWRANGNHSTGSRAMRLYVGLANGGQQTATDKFWLDDDGGPRPASDNTVSNGSASNRWSQIYAGNNVINTSDAREKTAVRALTDAEIAAAKELSKEIGAFRFLSAIEQKGDAARTHIGMTVQRAIEIMQSHGLDPMAYGFICFDKWGEMLHRAAVEAKPAVLDDDGNVLQSAVEAQDAIIQPAGERYGFRTDQLLLFIARGFEARLSALEGA